MQVGQFPSIHLSSNWRSLQRMLAFQQWHKHKHTHTHTFFGTVLRRKKTGTSHRYVLNAVITWAPEWGQTCCIKIMLVTFFSGHRFQEHLWNSFKSYGFTYRHRTPASLPRQALLPFLEKNQSWDSAPTCKHFLWQKNNCETKPHGRQKLNNKNIQQTKLANNSHNIHELKTNLFSIFSHDLKTPNGMGDPGGTCGTTGVTAGGTAGVTAGSKGWRGNQGPGRKKRPRNMAFLRKVSYCLFMVFSSMGFYVLKPNIEKWCWKRLYIRLSEGKIWVWSPGKLRDVDDRSLDSCPLKYFHGICRW